MLLIHTSTSWFMLSAVFEDVSMKKHTIPFCILLRLLRFLQQPKHNIKTFNINYLE
jgi:hypothetical protein